jgi:hypothetical protein
MTPQILCLSSHPRHCPLVSVSTTLSISPKILLLKLSSVIYLPSFARWTLWVLLNGSLVFISLGASPLLQLTSISTSLILLQTLSSFACQACNETPTATPYQSGIPIDSIAPSVNADDSPAQIQ